MPRIYSSCSDPLDFCNDCWNREGLDEEEYAESVYGDVEKTGEGPDGRGNCFSHDDDHPCYDDFGDYHCESCGCPLTAEDN